MIHLEVKIFHIKITVVFIQDQGHSLTYVSHNENVKKIDDWSRMSYG